jgi:hypothetical protein
MARPMTSKVGETKQYAASASEGAEDDWNAIDLNDVVSEDRAEGANSDDKVGDQDDSCGCARVQEYRNGNHQESRVKDQKSRVPVARGTSPLPVVSHRPHQ